MLFRRLLEDSSDRAQSGLSSTFHVLVLGGLEIRWQDFLSFEDVFKSYDFPSSGDALEDHGGRRRASFASNWSRPGMVWWQEFFGCLEGVKGEHIDFFGIIVGPILVLELLAESFPVSQGLGYGVLLGNI